MNIFSRLNFNHDFDKEKDILGRVYEYFLGQFASAEGKRGGEFYTPRSIVELLVQILEPYENARIFDPACGSGGMFVQSGRFLETHHKNPTHISIYGQESNPTTYKLCRMNLAIRGIFGEVAVGSSYYDDKFPDLRADFVLANPPFNAEWEPRRLSESDPRIKFGAPPASNANFMWIQHFLHHLAPNGMAGFVMANGALAVSGREGEIRKKLIEADLIDVIIACPPKLFYNVTLPVSLWFVAKNKNGDRFRKRAGETLFIDARDTFEQISRKQVRFTPEQIEKISGTVRAWRLPAARLRVASGQATNSAQAGGEKCAPVYKDVAGFCKAVKIEEIAKAGFVLTPGRFVWLPDEVDDLPAPRPNTFYVYAIKCDNASIYIGQTEDLRKRWQEHITGTASDWTKRHKPKMIVHHEIFATRDEAVKREQELKTGFGRKWLHREIANGRARQAGGVPFEEKMQKLSAELKTAFKKGDELEWRIIGNLKKLVLN